LCRPAWDELLEVYISNIVTPARFRCLCVSGQWFDAQLSLLSPLEAGEWDDECCRRLQELCQGSQQRLKVLDSDSEPVAVTILTQDGTIEEQLIEERFARPQHCEDDTGDQPVVEYNVTAGDDHLMEEHNDASVDQSMEEYNVDAFDYQPTLQSMAAKIVSNSITGAQQAVSRQESVDTLPMRLLRATSPADFVVQLRTTDFLRLEQVLQQIAAVAKVEKIEVNGGDNVLVQDDDGTWCRSTVIAADEQHVKVQRGLWSIGVMTNIVCGQQFSCGILLHVLATTPV